MPLLKKILFTVPTLIFVWYLMSAFFPVEFSWMYPSMRSYNVQVSIVKLIQIIQLIGVIRILWRIKRLEKNIKWSWTWLMIFLNPVTTMYFVWVKFDELNN